MSHDWASAIRRRLAALVEAPPPWLRPLDRCVRCGGVTHRNQVIVIAERGYRHDICPQR